ncbi:MAG: PP2C family protein-serine/threonine phosphatase [Ardenticatenaceae bacterium]
MNSKQQSQHQPLTEGAKEGQAAKEALAAQAAKRQILIVDGNRSDRNRVFRFLAALGYRSIEAKDEQEALSLLQTQPFDLVLLKPGPKVGGQALLQTLHSTPLIVLSDDLSLIELWLEIGAADYLLLPFTARLLQARVQTHLVGRALTPLPAEQESHIKHEELLKIEQDLRIARRIQAGFLPSQLPQPSGWELAARFQPAREVAGDFYDAFMLSQNRRVGFVIADVVDKGVPAALFMALVRSLTRAFARQRHSLSWANLLEEAPSRRGRRQTQTIPSTGTMALKNAVLLTNNYIMDNHLELNMFATLFFGMFDPKSGALAYINAGHNPPFIVGADGTLKAKLKPSGPAVGMFPDVDYQIDHAHIDHGDILFAYTDGVTEARDPDKNFFSEKRLLTLLADPVLSATALVERIGSTLNHFIADATQFDDITMIAVQRQLAAEQ